MSILKRANGFAFKKGSVWNTAVEPGSGDQLMIESFTPPSGERNLVSDAEEMGVPLESRICLADYPEQSGSFVGKMYVADTKIMEIIASIGGEYGFAADTPEAGANTHTVPLQRLLTTDIYHTIAHDEGAEVKAINSAKFGSISISLDQIFKHTTSFMGTVYEAKSGFTTPLSITADDKVACFKLENTTVRINEQDDAALDSGDNQSVTNVTISIARGYQSLAPTAGTAYISDIVDANQYTVELTFEYPKKTAVNAAYLPDYQTNEIYKASVLMTGPTITGTSTAYSIGFYFPGLYLKSAPSFNQETPYPATAVFGAQYDLAGDASMSYKVPYIVMINDQATLSGYPAIAET